MPSHSSNWQNLARKFAWLLAFCVLYCGCTLPANTIRPCVLRDASISAPTSATQLVEESRRYQQTARALADSNDERCVDWYFAAIRSAWRAAIAADMEGAPTDLRSA